MCDEVLKDFYRVVWKKVGKKEDSRVRDLAILSWQINNIRSKKLYLISIINFIKIEC